MKVVLDLHDFSVVNNRLELILKLKEHFPNLKVSLFTIPVDKREDFGPSLLRGQYLNEIKKHLSWMQIIPHGLYHNRQEVRKWNYGEANHIFDVIEDLFRRDGLPFVKGFCAPHWKWNADVVRVMDERGWWGAVYKTESVPYPKKFYHLTHCIDEPFSLDAEVLKLHGHVYGGRNDLGKCFANLLRLPKDTEWCYATDFLEDRK